VSVHIWLVLVDNSYKKLYSFPYRVNSLMFFTVNVTKGKAVYTMKFVDNYL